ncbi:AsmA family protein [Amphiplicatus metriothermophilus]|uniref:AsmA protein n=1 Tax=Amphiplicatus metriothermophilus TaxID=1519374 RepID=A0A239PV64_9PROT|nr:AsmA family protein [Amphiplicatus metriothermophilus]MBB5519416.1 AsmA protein [Amphiplicatus metriothermophilus]SNT73577.1 AsmA protein [Amphiplicatus metriothermophilus]
MKKFLLALVVLVLLVAVIIVVAPGLVPAAAYKGRLEAAASEAIGRSVTVDDDLSFKIIPRPAFRVSGLEIANAEGFAAPYLARVASADIGVKLWPLFSGAVEIERFVLIEPEIHLARAADGRANWILARAAEEAAAPAEPGATPEIGDLRLGDVRIVDGRASYADAAAGQTYAAEAINAAARLDSLDQPLEFEGTMLFQGAPSKIDLVLTSPAKLMKKEPANLKLDAAIGETVAGADLALRPGADSFSYAGPVRFDAPDLRALAALLGAPLADSPGFDSLSVEGEAAGDANGVRLADAKIVFDKIDAEGDLALDWSGARPKATGRLAVGALDLRPYLPPPAENAAGFPAWSEEKLDFSGLRNIDADIDATAEQIFLNNLTFGRSRLKLLIDDGRLTAEIPELGVYGGAGSGRLVVNARGATPSLSGVFDVGAVQAQPFAEDLMRIDRLLGLGGFKLEFTAAGSTQAAIMRSLDGAGGFDLADGAIKGVNLAKLAQAVSNLRQQGFNPAAVAAAVAAAQAPHEETEYSEFLSRFSIADGVVDAPTISLVGPFVQMAGTGKIDLPAQTLDLRLIPKASTAADGEGGRSLAIPLRVSGTFAQPRIAVDVEALARGRAESALQQLLGGAGRDAGRNGTAGRLLEGVFGTRPAADEPAQEGTGAESSAEAAPQRSVEETLADEALKQLFGRKKKKPASGEEEPPSESPKDPQ